MFKKLFNWKLLILLLIIALGAFLRFYRFWPNFMFNGEMGTDYMNVWNMLHGTRTFLIGPRTSHEWFFISPIAYWIYAVLFLIWNYSPIVINIFWGIVGVLAVPICYFTVKNIFNRNVALVSSFLLAVSPAWIIQTRNSRYNLVVSILFLPYLLYLVNSIKDKGKSLFKLGLVLGLTMSFFPSPILLIPASIVSFIFYNVKPKLKYVLYFIVGFILPNITFIIYEIGNKFAITINLLTWIPYRILGFFGLYNKNTVDISVLSQNTSSIYRFFAESFVGQTGTLSLILFITTIALSIYFLIRYYKNRKNDIPFYILFISLIVSYVGLFIHGNPPEHYYYVIYPILVILMAYILDKLFGKKIPMMLITLLLGVIGIFWLIKTNWFSLDRKPINYDVNLAPYTTQLKIADAIIKEAKGLPISIRRIGIYDQFENDYANNYIFLLTTRGVKVDTNSKNIYTIIEGKENYRKIFSNLVFSENDVYVFKNSI